MSKSEFLDFRDWLWQVSTDSDEPLMARWPNDQNAPISVRVDPFARLRKGLGIVASEVVQIPGGASLHEAKTITARSLIKRSLCRSTR